LFNIRSFIFHTIITIQQRTTEYDDNNIDIRVNTFLLEALK